MTADRIFRSLTGLWEVSDWISVRSRPPPKGKKRRQKRSPRKRRRVFGTNSLKEGAMWYVAPLLGNDRERINNTTAVTRQRSVKNSTGMVFSVRSVPRSYK
jgi:hypothetical protein